MGDVVAAIASGLLCGFILNTFFRCLKHGWPQNYFGLSGSVDPIVSRNLARWAAFRLIPPALAITAGALTAERYGGSPIIAGILVVVVHLRRIFLLTLRDVRRRRWSVAAGSAVTLVLLVTVMIGAWLARQFFAPIIPDPSELVSNLWAGFLAATGAVYLQQIALVRRKPRELLVKSFEEIPFDFRVHVYELAVNAGVDPRIPLAIMMAENLERPRWLRRIEQLIPRRLDATRGLMQQEGARDDWHSIDLAFQRYIATWKKAAVESPWGPMTAFEQYNLSDEFQQLAVGAFETLDNNPFLMEVLRRAVEKSRRDF